VGNVVLEVLSLGYEPRELQDSLQSELDRWQRANGTK
jgi:hypothetical protein